MTLTAPGLEVLPWAVVSDDSGEIEDYGRVEPRCADRWNADAGQRWSWFVTYLRREVGPVEFFKAWEFQKRGVLHVHALVRVENPVSRRRFRRVAQSCALQWGFGRQIDVQHIAGGDAAEVARKAGYVAKYASKGADAVLGFVVCDDAGEVVRRGSVRPWTASRRWGDSMATVKARQRVWAATRWRATAPEGSAAAVALVQRSGTKATGGEAVGVALDLKNESYTECVGVGVPCSM